MKMRLMACAAHMENIQNFEPSSNVPDFGKYVFWKRAIRERDGRLSHGIKFCPTYSVFQTLVSENLSFSLSSYKLERNHNCLL
jgi:hypothetical protein